MNSNLSEREVLIAKSRTLSGSTVNEIRPKLFLKTGYYGNDLAARFISRKVNGVTSLFFIVYLLQTKIPSLDGNVR